MDVVLGLFYLVPLVLLIWCTVICVKKGKPGFAILGWLLFLPLLVIGAIRIAKPTSKWAAKYENEPLKKAASLARFPKQAHELELRKQLVAAQTP